MTLARGRHLMSIPGPTVMPDAVLNAMHTAAPNIYEGPLLQIAEEITVGLQNVARTTAIPAIYISNGHGVWETALANMVAPGDKVLALVTGRFGQGWAEIAEGLGVEVEVLGFGTAAPVDPQQVEDRLRKDTVGQIKAVITVHTDTSTSIRNDIAAVRQAMDAAGHDALLAVDCIASLACEPFEMDGWGVDVLVAACQKGLMTPPGLGFNFVNEKALAVRKTQPRVSRYNDWLPRVYPQAFYQRFCGTAPTHHLLGLHKALEMLQEEGIEAVWARHQALAEIVWSAIDVWSELGDIRFNVADPAHRSTSVTTLHTAPGDAVRLRQWCETQAGLTLGIGLTLGDAGPNAGDDLFRIGHMGHLSPPMVMGTLGCIDAGLKALGIEHGGGALRVASEHLAARA